MRRRLSAGALLATTALVLFGWQAPAAHAESGEHCVAGLSETEVTDFRCFDTFAAALEYATSGRVELEAEARSVTTERLVADGAISTETELVAQPLLGVEYENTGFGTPSLSLYGSSGTGCYSGRTYEFDSLGAYGWDNRPSSARTYSNCLGRHYANTNQGGDYRDCWGSGCSSLGDLNNRTSSLKYF